jgi:TusA-related sulfurtransferase
MTDPQDSPAPEPIANLDGTGESCATFTPIVAARMRHMAPGELLEVVTDDASAPDALASWARLTGNHLVETRREPDGRWAFVLRRRDRD